MLRQIAVHVLPVTHRRVVAAVLPAQATLPVRQAAPQAEEVLVAAEAGAVVRRQVAVAAADVPVVAADKFAVDERRIYNLLWN